MIAKLALEDGSVFAGRAFGAPGERFGEVVFNTSMTGYQEIVTDPSYSGQIVTMTYPHIGNYGVNADDAESQHPRVEGFVVRELARHPSNPRSTQSLDEYLKSHGIPGIEGIDTRALVRRLRVRGAMTGVLSTIDLDDASLVRKAQAAPRLVGRDLVRQVVPQQSCEWTGGGLHSLTHSGLRISDLGLKSRNSKADVGVRHVAAIDFGMKWNIPRYLVESGCRVTIVPGTAGAAEVLAHKPDGIFLSNGPGDPAVLDYAIETIRGLIGRRPIFGICLGHQLLGQALGAKTFKLKFGHHGANHPVLNLRTGAIEITTQNHGFAIDLDSLPADVEPTHVNLNDRTNEGLRHTQLPVFSVQYHPESSAGPHDSDYLFDEFVKMMG
jgi:carbamoyl-phosphate synthase small subunit